jgi:exonuclease SbcC
VRLIRIKSTNFLSHSETVLDLKGYDAVVVTGPNGSGKSSLFIDSVLVALFGRGRSGDLDAYVKNGQNLLIVEVDFSLNGNYFRVTRKRSTKTSRGTSLLEFYQIDEEGQEIKQMTLGAIAETQALIEKTIGIDYDTLIRSSIIEQGEATKFCEAVPSERMELLTKIWDLERYAELSTLAKEEGSILKEKIRASENTLTAIRERISDAESKKAELESLRTELDSVNRSSADLEKKKAGFEKKAMAFDGLLKELDRIEHFQKINEAEMKRLAEQHRGCLSKIERFEKILKNRDVVTGKVEEEKKLAERLAAVELRNIETMNRIDGVNELINGLNKDSANLSREDQKLEQMKRSAEKLKGIACHPEIDPKYINQSCRFIKDAVEAKRTIPAFEKKLKQDIAEIEDVLHQHELEKRRLSEARRQSLEEIKQIKTGLEALKKYTILLPEIGLAEREMPGLVEEEKILSQKGNELSKEVERLKRETNNLKKELRNRNGIETRLQSICNRLEEAKERRDEITKKLGFLEGESNKIDDLKTEMDTREKEMKGFEADRPVYQALEEAFKAIPYMLISRGMGIIENIANEILSMISSSGLRVKIETVRMAKSTKRMRDEIHLTVSDQDGEKEYKFLSGGEKLRVGLAVRLAISEALAHRRGTRVESLIADEPFGPLDIEGIEDMKECMRKLKERFSFMCVITHIERAQDIFPAQITFKKGKNGTEAQLSNESF